MSSPYTGSNYGYPDRATASSPGLGHRRTEAPQGSEDVSVRPMRREWTSNLKTSWIELKFENVQSKYSIHLTTRIKQIALLDGHKFSIFARLA